MDLRAFYDDYVGRQLAADVNERHHAILGWLRRFGLRPGHRVLEIGAGVGTVTGLIAKTLGPGGFLVAVDLSPKSIEAAHKRLEAFDQVRLIAADVLSVEIKGPFDVILLPDVIEHIPLSQHSELFARIKDWLAADGFVLLHYPNPHHLAWCHEHRPDLLQALDQPIHANVLTANAYANGLYLDYLETYSIWVREGDYQVAVLRLFRDDAHFHSIHRKPSLLARVRGKLRTLIRGGETGSWQSSRTRPTDAHRGRTPGSPEPGV